MNNKEINAKIKSGFIDRQNVSEGLYDWSVKLLIMMNKLDLKARNKNLLLTTYAVKRLFIFREWNKLSNLTCKIMVKMTSKKFR